MPRTFSLKCMNNEYAAGPSGHKARALALTRGSGEITRVNDADRPGAGVTIFIDYVCPFSYLSALALAHIGAEASIAVDWRAFELRPAPLPMLGSFSDDEWRIVDELARDAGQEIRRPSFRPRTRKAHEAVKYAASIEQGDALQRAIFAAYFMDGRDIGRIDVLTDVAAAIGIDRMSIKVTLDVDAHTDEVLADIEYARVMEIEGTPAFVAGNDVRVGYLSADHLREWLED